VPRQLRPSLIELDYARDIIRLVDVRAAFAPLLEALPGLLESAALARKDTARADAGETERLAQLAERARSHLGSAISLRAIEDLARAVAHRTAIHQGSQLARQVRAVLGVDVLGTDARLPVLMEGFVAENVALIRAIPGEIATRIEKTVMRGASSGLLAKDIASDLDADFALGRQRAHLIARDQVGKFYGQVNGARQKDLGVRRYIWRGVLDRRERAHHVAREGQVFSWDRPPEGGHPGEEILCRCTAEPVLSDVLGP
jgi:SPP1 gp7 family putative phage head morphogenesis protein